MKPTFTIGEILKTSWASTKKNWKFLVSATFIFFVVSSILNGVGRGPASLVLAIASCVVSIMFSIGMYKIGLLIESGGTPKAEDFKTELNTFLSVLWANIVVSFFIIIGLILLIIPGIIVVTRLSMTVFLIIDKKLKAWPAIKESWRITSGYSWKILGFMLVVTLIAFISIIPFGLGLLISIPFLSLAQAVLYRKISATA